MILSFVEKFIHLLLSLILIYTGVKLRNDSIFEKLCSDISPNALRVGDMIPPVDVPHLNGSMFGEGYCVRNTPNFLLIAGILLLISSCLGIAQTLGITKERFTPSESEKKPINNKFEQIREKYKKRLRERYRR